VPAFTTREDSTKRTQTYGSDLGHGEDEEMAREDVRNARNATERSRARGEFNAER
jgi:hypothetical protein